MEGAEEQGELGLVVHVGGVVRGHFTSAILNFSFPNYSESRNGLITELRSSSFGKILYYCSVRLLKCCKTTSVEKQLYSYFSIDVYFLFCLTVQFSVTVLPFDIFSTLLSLDCHTENIFKYFGHK